VSSRSALWKSRISLTVLHGDEYRGLQANVDSFVRSCVIASAQFVAIDMPSAAPHSRGADGSATPDTSARRQQERTNSDGHAVRRNASRFTRISADRSRCEQLTHTRSATRRGNLVMPAVQVDTGVGKSGERAREQRVFGPVPKSRRDSMPR